jgi:high-affinity iron transporter
VFAAGLVADAIQNMQELGWITLGNAHLWSTAHLLSEDSMLGDILHAFIGYAQSPTALQLSLYVLYLILFGTYFWRLTRKPQPKTAPATQAVASPPRA